MAMLTIEGLRGMWRRTLLEWPSALPDTTTTVSWLQGPRFFIDLRQPANRPDFTGITCIRQFDEPHLTWLGTQEGFAGSLHLDGDIACWHREIDFQPPAATADRARLRMRGQSLEERGMHVGYLEQWERAHGPSKPAFGLELFGSDCGSKGYLVRVDDRFMYARSRRQSLPSGCHLMTLLGEMSDITAKQDLLDFEISAGRIESATGVWRIQDSSLPFREGGVLMLPGQPIADRFTIHDVDSTGLAFSRAWVVVDQDAAGPAIAPARCGGERP